MNSVHLPHVDISKIIRDQPALQNHAEDVQGNQRYSCEELQTKGCLESDMLLTLHNVTLARYP